MNEPDRLCRTCAFWARKLQESTSVQVPLGECRRYPPTGNLHSGMSSPTLPVGAGSEARTGWPRTLDRDWCGEWAPAGAMMPDDTLDEEQERELRNAAMAQALLALSPEKRDQLLCDILTEEERDCPTPPPDFYERVQEYFARQKQHTSD